jgi:hypothetical protein
LTARKLNPRSSPALKEKPFDSRQRLRLSV